MCACSAYVWLTDSERAELTFAALGNPCKIPEVLGMQFCVYLMEVSFGVSQEGDAVSLWNADGHRSQTGGRGVPRGSHFQRRPACHGAWGVVRPTWVRLQGVLREDTSPVIQFVTLITTWRYLLLRKTGICVFPLLPQSLLILPNSLKNDCTMD